MQNVIFFTSEIIERLKRVQGYQNDAELARDLGVPPKKLAVWKLRNTVPLEELTSFCRHHAYNLEWALTGEGSTKRQQPSEVQESGTDFEPQRKLGPVTKKIDHILAEMTEDQRRDVLKYAQEKKLLAELIAEHGKK